MIQEETLSEAVVVLTSKSLETMFEEGGSGHWKANEDRITRCRYLVAVRHGHSGWSEDETPHNTAFLIGRSLSVLPGDGGRIIIGFQEYAPIEVANVWPGNRNPVAYLDLEGLGIDLASLEWKPFPTHQVVEENRAKPLTIEEAKLGLARALGISKNCIEITIRA